MNWKRLKERFPKSYREIRELYSTSKLEGRALINKFLENKGYKNKYTFINNLKYYESTNEKII